MSDYDSDVEPKQIDTGSDVEPKQIDMGSDVEPNLLKDGERLDDLERSNLKIIQHPGVFCFGMDAVLLSGYVSVKKNEVALDLCTGQGIIPILLTAKTSGKHFTGIEIQEGIADMARRSVILNHLEEKVDIICADIKDALDFYKSGSFDVITVNPPYMIGNHGLKNNSETKTIARHEIKTTLNDVLDISKRLLRTNGRLYMVHRPFRLAEIMHSMVERKLEPKRMRFVYPFIDKEPNMVLIEAIKGGNSRVTVEKSLIIYGKDGKYTQEIYDIYGY